MKTYQIVLLCDRDQSSLLDRVPDELHVHQASQFEQCLGLVEQESISLIILDVEGPKEDVASTCSVLTEHEAIKDTPVLIYSKALDLQDRLRCFEAGCHDIIAYDIADEELKALLLKAVYSKIANDQLKGQLQQANEMAFIAMSDTSDLGVNLRFLIESVSCNNLDELGMLLFQATRSYGIHCSLQMRSRYGTKNMEENGMVKNLESQLLDQLKDAGRYYDFGKRTVSNCGRVSLLMKNMPEDEKKYGAIKDNSFTLMQGLDARVQAIDNQMALKQERLVLEKLSHRMKDIMHNIEIDHQLVMRGIAEVVDRMAEKMDESILYLGLTEEQEKIIETIIEECILNTNKVFNEGLKVDEGFHTLIAGLAALFGTSENGVSAEAIQDLIYQLGGDEAV